MTTLCQKAAVHFFVVGTTCIATAVIGCDRPPKGELKLTKPKRIPSTNPEPIRIETRNERH